MEIHWHDQVPLEEELKQGIERRLQQLGDGHADLIHIVIHVERSHNQRHGSAEAKIRCQARGREHVVHEHDQEPAPALERAVEAFEREVRETRRRLSGASRGHRGR